MKGRICGSAAAVLAVVVTGGPGLSQEMPPVSIDVGDPAPEFSCLDDRGWTWKSSDRLPQKYLVLVFFRGDFHEPSNMLLAGYRNGQTALADRGVDVIGVSGDTVQTHRLYKDLHAWSFLLLADVDGRVAGKFAVPVCPGGKARVRDSDGKSYPPRSRHSWIVERGVSCACRTFIIAPDGTVLYASEPADAAPDTQQVLDFISKHQHVAP